MKSKNILFIGLILIMAVFAGGCFVTSLYPLYTEQDVIFDPGLLGKWKEGKDIWEFQRMEKEDDSYQVIIIQDGSPVGMLEGHLVKLDKYMFMDYIPSHFVFKDDSNNVIKDVPDDKILWWNQAHLIPTHSFGRISIEGDSLKISLLDIDWFKKMVKENKINIKYEETEDNFLLTASTEELQKFVVKYAEDEKVFNLKDDPLYRIKDKD
ncbi:hypothetical protein ACFL40_04295 [candidate division KSB1 bacterium]